MVHFEKSDLLRLARTVSPALFESEYVPDQMALDLVAQINDLMQKLSDLLVVAEAPKVDSTFILNQDSPNGATFFRSGVGYFTRFVYFERGGPANFNKECLYCCLRAWDHRFAMDLAA